MGSFTPARALDPNAAFSDYQLDKWSVDDGLPQISVLSLTQDHRGYLWVGTQNGIARFDGLRFTVFDRTHGGVDTTLAAVAWTDREDAVWFGTPRGAVRMKDGQVREFKTGGEPLSVTAFAEDAQGLWLGTGRGLYRVDGDALRPSALPDQAVYSLLQDGGVLWIGGEGKLWRRGVGGVQVYPLPESDLRVGQILARPDGLWLGTQRGLYRFQPRSGTWDAPHPDLQGHAIESLAGDREGNLWIGTSDRLVRQRGDGVVERITADDFIANPWIRTIYEDREGNLWLGSYRDSLFRLRDSPFAWIAADQGLKDYFVWSVSKDAAGRRLIGSMSNIERETTPGRFEELVPGSALPQASGYSLDVDSDDTLWIGTRGGLAFWRDGRLQRPAALAVLDAYQINSVQRIAADDYWIASMGGLYRYHAGRLDRVGAAPGTTEAKVRCLLRVSEDRWLIGTEDGVRQVDGERVTVPNWSQPLIGMMVSRIAWLRPGLLGLATMDAGLGLMAKDHLLLLTPEQGLPSRNGWTLDVIGNYLYIASIHGAFRIAMADLPDPTRPAPVHVPAQGVVPQYGRMINFKRQGCCNGGADGRSLVDGRYLWLTSTSGAIRLDTDAIPDRLPAPDSVIERLGNAGDTYNDNKVIALAGESRDVVVDYTGLSLVDSDQIEFRYRLAGYDELWKEAGSRRSAFFTHLPPGEFRFEVQARRPGGDWGRPASAWSFRIVPRWYERRDLQIIGALALLLLIGGLVAWRLRELRMRQRELELAVSERTQELDRANQRLRHANEALTIESRTDVLTGLPNRRMVSRMATGAVARSQQRALLLVDIDHFKQINDRYGHAFGDQVLVEIAGLLGQGLRTGDQVARWGGEEFLVVLEHVDMTQALVLAERIRSRVAENVFVIPGQAPVRIGCSIGIAMDPLLTGLPRDWHGSLELADAAMYRAKRSGRNKVIGIDLSENASGQPAAILPAQIDVMVAQGILRWREAEREAIAFASR